MKSVRMVGRVELSVGAILLFGGMLAATVLSLIAVPMLYFIIQRTSDCLGGVRDQEPPASMDAEPYGSGDA